MVQIQFAGVTRSGRPHARQAWSAEQQAAPRAGSQPSPSADATGIAVEPESKSIPNPCMSWSPDSWPIAMQDWHLGTLVTANFSVGWLSLTSPYLEVVQSGTTPSGLIFSCVCAQAKVSGKTCHES